MPKFCAMNTTSKAIADAYAKQLRAEGKTATVSKKGRAHEVLVSFEEPKEADATSRRSRR